MSNFPKKARVVVIGAGIVGNSVIYHLAKLGWTDIVQVDKGPLPNPGGSTGHASNFIFPVDHGKEMALLTADSMRQYKELGVFTECGGIEVARTEARMEELRRRMASSKSWGIESRLVTPEEIKELVPFINEKILLGGFYTPSVGVVDSLRAGTIMREYAIEKGVLQTFANVEVTDVTVDKGTVSGVVTDRGTIEADYVVIACGLWSPRIAKMAGATIPLTPAVHQMISVGPVPVLSNAPGEISFPIVRDMDTLCYERQHGGDMEVGSYAHRAILHRPDDIPSIEESALTPTEMPFTEDDFDLQMEQALELMPEILEHEGAGVRYAINGLLSLTPDGYPILGETVEVDNLWSVAAVWIKEGPGVGRVIGEWMTHGYSEIDPHRSNIARFYDYAREVHHVEARTTEGFIKTYGIVHPREQFESNRNVRVSPFFAREQELGAVFYETAGWERPQWYESNAKLVDVYGDRVNNREHEWDGRWWSPIINAEHLNMRENVAMVDLAAFAIFDFKGIGAKAYMQALCVNQMNVKIGRSVYTPLLLANGGFKADLTVIRLGRDHYRVITGGGDGALDKKWFQQNLPKNGTVELHDLTSGLCTIGLWGPKARQVLETITEDDVSNEGIPYGAAKYIRIGGIKTLAFRISYVGELGWELTFPTESGLRAWDIISEAGKPFGIAPAGIGVYGGTGRLEKGYRLMGHELESEYNPVEAGLARSKVKKADFVGKEAYVKALASDPAALLCTLVVTDHTSKSGVKRFMQGNEPICTLDGKGLVDSHGRTSYVTSAGMGPSVGHNGQFILLAYLPADQDTVGNKLAVEYMTELYPVTVACVGNRPLFDPDNSRMKG